MGCSTNGISPILAYPFTVPKINHSYSAFLINHKIRGLGISVDKSLLVKMFEYEADLGDYDVSKARVKEFDHLKEFMEGQSLHWFEYYV